MSRILGINFQLNNARISLSAKRYRKVKEEYKEGETISLLGSADVESIIKEIRRGKSEIVYLRCDVGTLRFACRMINTINYHTKNNDREGPVFVVETEELQAGCYNMLDFNFRVKESERNISQYLDERKDEEYVSEVVRNLTFSELPAIWDETFRKAMENGFILYHTGLYPEQGSYSDYFKHAGVLSQNAEKVIKEARMDINSAFIIYGEDFSREAFEKYMSIPGVFSHFHFVDASGNVWLDDSGMRSNFTFMSLEEYVSNSCDAKLSDETYILKLESFEDYKALRFLMDNFWERGRITNPRFHIIDECCLLPGCYKSTGYRAFIDENEDVHAYLNDKFVAGKISDGNYRILAGLVKREFRDNEFDNQKAVDFEEYLLKKNFLNFLYSISETVKKAKDIIVPNSQYSVLLKGAACNGNRIPIHHLYVIDGVTYYFHRKKMSLVKMDPKLFIIMEGDIKGVSNSRIIEALEKYLSVDKDSAGKIYERGLDILSRDGLAIDRYINLIEERRDVRA